jgi:hypothetical protein
MRVSIYQFLKWPIFSPLNQLFVMNREHGLHICWAHALEKCVTNGTKTTICQSGRDFGVNRKTGQKWLARHAEGGMKN